MIRASVNGEEHDVSVEGVDTIDGLLKQLEVYVPPRDVIVELRINGVACDGSTDSRVRRLPAAGVRDVELRTCSPETFAGEAGGRFDTYLDGVRRRIERAVECFDRQRETEALTHYRDGVEELGLLVTLCDRLGKLGVQTIERETGIAGELQLICDRLWTAQDLGDLGALRAVLAERLLPLLDRWHACGRASSQV